MDLTYNINNFVDKIFLITTVNSKRIDYIKNNLYKHNINYDFIIAPDAKLINKDITVHCPGITGESTHVISLLSTHLSIIEYGIINELNSLCILEDDVYLMDNFDNEMELFLRNVPEYWDVINLAKTGHTSNITGNKINNYVQEMLCENCQYNSCAFTLFNKSIFNVYKDILMDIKDNFTQPVDILLKRIEHDKKYFCFTSVNKFITALSYRDDYDLRYLDGLETKFNSEIHP